MNYYNNFYDNELTDRGYLLRDDGNKKNLLKNIIMI